MSTALLRHLVDANHVDINEEDLQFIEHLVSGEIEKCVPLATLWVSYLGKGSMKSALFCLTLSPTSETPLTWTNSTTSPVMPTTSAWLPRVTSLGTTRSRIPAVSYILCCFVLLVIQHSYFYLFSLFFLLMIGRLLIFSRVINNEICFHAKEGWNLNSLFNSRYSMFKQVYPITLFISLRLICVS